MLPLADRARLQTGWALQCILAPECLTRLKFVYVYCCEAIVGVGRGDIKADGRQFSITESARPCSCADRSNAKSPGEWLPDRQLPCVNGERYIQADGRRASATCKC
ncbi:hypothetical protein LIA77_06611 [Sarocladium implicatum]|nr:hypothetical protein LIA77_06611 [Sarocladium implicatum]